MILYIALIAIVCVLFLIAGKRKKQSGIVLAIAFITMWLIAGVRSVSIGTDTRSYLDFFNSVVNEGLDVGMIANPMNIFIVDGFEKGFKLYTYFITLFTDNFTNYLLITYGFIYFSFYRFIKKYSLNYLLSFSIFATLFFFDSMNIMRQFIALAIITWGFGYLLQRHAGKYFIVVALATLFHQASLFMIIPYFLYGRRFTKLSLAAYGLGVAVALPLIAPMVHMIASTNARYETYIDKLGVFQLGSYLMAAFYLLVFVLMAYLSRKVSKKNLLEDGVFSISSVHFFLHAAAISVIASVLSIQMSGLNRTIEYFSLFLIVSLPLLFYYVRGQRGVASLEMGLVGVMVAYTFTILILRPEWLSVWPYVLVGN